MGGAYAIDPALEGARWAVETNAELYPIMRGCRSLRMVRTNEFAGPAGDVPALRVYFKIISDNLVELCWVEELI